MAARKRSRATGATRRTGRDTARQRAATRLTSPQRIARLVAAGYWSGDFTGDDHADDVDGDDGPAGDEFPDGVLYDDENDPTFPSAPDPEAPGQRASPVPIISFWMDSNGQLDWEVRDPGPHLLDDPVLRSAVRGRRERLEGLAALLASKRREVLLASTPADGLRLLARNPMSNKDLAAELGVETRTGSWGSREADLLIGAPFGTVPLAYFTSWVIDEGLLEGLEALARVLAESPAITDSGAAKEAAARLHAADRAEPLRKQAKHVRALIRHPGTVTKHRRAFPLTTWQALREDVGMGADPRGKQAYCMALVGLIPPDTPAEK